MTNVNDLVAHLHFLNIGPTKNWFRKKKENTEKKNFPGAENPFNKYGLIIPVSGIVLR